MSVLDKIEEQLDIAQQTLDGMEVESAPSGEWEEYNYHYMIQEAIVETWQEAFILAGGEFAPEDEK